MRSGLANFCLRATVAAGACDDRQRFLGKRRSVKAATAKNRVTRPVKRRVVGVAVMTAIWRWAGRALPSQVAPVGRCRGGALRGSPAVGTTSVGHAEVNQYSCAVTYPFDQYPAIGWTPYKDISFYPDKSFGQTLFICNGSLQRFSKNADNGNLYIRFTFLEGDSATANGYNHSS